MTCNGFKELEGCGSCLIKLTNANIIKELSTISITDICDKVFLWCCYNTDKKLDISKSVISCSGDIGIRYDIELDEKNNKKSYILDNRKTCRKFVRSWYKYHKCVMYDALCLVYMSKIVSIMDDNKPEKEMLDETMKLNDAFNIIMDRQ